MSQSVLLDTSVWIELLRSEAAERAIVERRWRLRLSAVTLSELRRGVRSTVEQRFVASLVRSFPAQVPNVAQWLASGQVLAALRDQHHYDARGLRDLQNDVLIALGAREIGCPVATLNVEDFRRIAASVRGLKVIPFEA